MPLEAAEISKQKGEEAAEKAKEHEQKEGIPSPRPGAVDAAEKISKADVVDKVTRPTKPAKMEVETYPASTTDDGAGAMSAAGAASSGGSAKA